jgi:hypothetical protein
MLLTPLGAIRVFVNNNEIEFYPIRYILDSRCSNLNGRYLIQYKYNHDYKIQRIRCCLPNIATEGDIESGERLEAISFYKDFTKVTIGAEAAFGLEEEYEYDYSGSYVSNGVEYETTLTTNNQIFQFGVSWIRPFTEENEYETVYGAEPSIMHWSKNI